MSREKIAEKSNCGHDDVEAKQGSIFIKIALGSIKANIWNYLGNTINIPPQSIPFNRERDQMAERNQNILDGLSKEDKNLIYSLNEKGHTLYEQTIGEVLKEADQQGYKRHPFVEANRDLFEEE